MTEDEKLTPNNVEKIFLDCLFKDGENTDNAVLVDGIVLRVGFNPERLAAHKEEVRALLAQLPDPFHAEVIGAGGWTFLNACYDANGVQWTGEHRSMEQLFMLGEGLDFVHSLLPRDMWTVLPGGMPYYMVTGCRPAATEQPHEHDWKQEGSFPGVGVDVFKCACGAEGVRSMADGSWKIK